VGLRDLYCLVSKHYVGEQIQKSEMGWECSTLGGSRGAYKILTWQFKGKGQLPRPSVNGLDIIRKDVQEIFCSDVD
jgi:hypothetical protein